METGWIWGKILDQSEVVQILLKNTDLQVEIRYLKKFCFDDKNKFKYGETWFYLSLCKYLLKTHHMFILWFLGWNYFILNTIVSWPVISSRKLLQTNFYLINVGNWMKTNMVFFEFVWILSENAADINLRKKGHSDFKIKNICICWFCEALAKVQ